MAASAGKSFTMEIGTIAVHGREFSISYTTREVEVTNEDSSGAEEFVAGIEGVRGTARGYSSTTVTKPAAACSATFTDGAGQVHAFNALVTECTVSNAIDGACEVNLSFVRSAA